MENSIRKALLAPHNEHRRLDALWRHRINCLIQGAEYLQLALNPKVFMHVVPLNSESFIIDRNNQQNQDAVRNLPLLFERYPSTQRINIDGFFGCNTIDKPNPSIASYYQLFWDGSIEFCSADWIGAPQDSQGTLNPFPLPYFEYQILQTLKTTIRVLQSLSIPVPVRLYLALAGVRGYVAIRTRYPFPGNYSFDRNELLFEPVNLDVWEAEPQQVMRPIFDQLWNAAGYLRSYSYDEQGMWKPDLR